MLCSWNVSNVKPATVSTYPGSPHLDADLQEIFVNSVFQPPTKENRHPPCHVL